MFATKYSVVCVRIKLETVLVIGKRVKRKHRDPPTLKNARVRHWIYLNELQSELSQPVGMIVLQSLYQPFCGVYMCICFVSTIILYIITKHVCSYYFESRRNDLGGRRGGNKRRAFASTYMLFYYYKTRDTAKIRSSFVRTLFLQNTEYAAIKFYTDRKWRGRPYVFLFRTLELAHRAPYTRRVFGTGVDLQFFRGGCVRSIEKQINTRGQ